MALLVGVLIFIGCVIGFLVICVVTNWGYSGTSPFELWEELSDTRLRLKRKKQLADIEFAENRLRLAEREQALLERKLNM